jgi:hypothetical protein
MSMVASVAALALVAVLVFGLKAIVSFWRVMDRILDGHTGRGDRARSGSEGVW